MYNIVGISVIYSLSAGQIKFVHGPPFGDPWCIRILTYFYMLSELYNLSLV